MAGPIDRQWSAEMSDGSMGAAKRDVAQASRPALHRPIDRVVPVEQAVERNKDHLLSLPTGPKSQRPSGGLDPRAQVRARNAEVWNIEVVAELVDPVIVVVCHVRADQDVVLG